MTSISSPNGRFLAVLLVLIMLGGVAPLQTSVNVESVEAETLEESTVQMNSASSCSTCQSYNLYLDEANSESGGEGSITTLEPTGAHQEASAFGGVEFRSAEMISDLLVYGRDTVSYTHLRAHET